MLGSLEILEVRMTRPITAAAHLPPKEFQRRMRTAKDPSRAATGR